MRKSLRIWKSETIVDLTEWAQNLSKRYLYNLCLHVTPDYSNASHQRVPWNSSKLNPIIAGPKEANFEPFFRVHTEGLTFFQKNLNFYDSNPQGWSLVPEKKNLKKSSGTLITTT